MYSHVHACTGAVLTVVLMAVRGRPRLADISDDMFLGYTPIRSFVEEESLPVPVGRRAEASASVRGKWNICGPLRNKRIKIPPSLYSCLII